MEFNEKMVVWKVVVRKKDLVPTFQVSDGEAREDEAEIRGQVEEDGAADPPVDALPVAVQRSRGLFRPRAGQARNT